MRHRGRLGNSATWGHKLAGVFVVSVLIDWRLQLDATGSREREKHVK